MVLPETSSGIILDFTDIFCMLSSNFRKFILLCQVFSIFHIFRQFPEIFVLGSNGFEVYKSLIHAKR